MDTDARRKAQQRMERIARFREELAELEREQGLILTAEQRSRLDAHLDTVRSGLTRQFGVDASESARRISWGMRVASLLGGAALFAAGALFLHRIWGGLPSAAHVLLLTVVPVALLAGAEVAFRRLADHFYTMLLATAAVVALVMEVGAMGSVFNSVPSPHALLAWSSFALLVAYAYGLRLLLGAGLLLGCAYAAALGIAAGGGYWAAVLERSEFLIPPATLLYAVPWLARGPDPRDFRLVYRLCGAGAGLVALLGVSLSGRMCCGGLEVRLVEGLSQVAGLGLSAGVVVHGLRLGRSGLVNLGALMFVVFLYARLHAWWWHWMPRYLFFLALGLTALALLIVFRKLRAQLPERSLT